MLLISTDWSTLPWPLLLSFGMLQWLQLLVLAQPSLPSHAYKHTYLYTYIYIYILSTPDEKYVRICTAFSAALPACPPACLPAAVAKSGELMRDNIWLYTKTEAPNCTHTYTHTQAHQLTLLHRCECVCVLWCFARKLLLIYMPKSLQLNMAKHSTRRTLASDSMSSSMFVAHRFSKGHTLPLAIYLHLPVWPRDMHNAAIHMRFPA